MKESKRCGDGWAPGQIQDAAAVRPAVASQSLDWRWVLGGWALDHFRGIDRCVTETFSVPAKLRVPLRTRPLAFVQAKKKAAVRWWRTRKAGPGCLQLRRQ